MGARCASGRPKSDRSFADAGSITTACTELPSEAGSRTDATGGPKFVPQVSSHDATRCGSA